MFFGAAEANNGSNTWIERVPSASNCADGPSKGRFGILTTTGLNVRIRRLPASYERNLAAQWKRREATGPMAPSSEWGCA